MRGMQGDCRAREGQGVERKEAPPQGARAGPVQVRQRRVRAAGQVQVRARRGVQAQVLPQPQAAAARPAACTGPMPPASRRAAALRQAARCRPGSRTAAAPRPHTGRVVL